MRDDHHNKAPHVMTPFSGDIEELEEKLAYELSVLEYLRQALFNEVKSTDSIAITLGDVTEEGRQKQTHNMAFHESMSAGAVTEALSRFRPLAFSAAYKMHDMISEWILKNNPGWTEDCWRFGEKIKLHKRLETQGELIQPEVLAERPAVSSAFWELYRRLTPYRNTLAHTGGVSIGYDGSLHVALLGKPSFNFSSEQQSAYIRTLCIIVKSLLGHAPLDRYREAVVEASLATLASYHSIESFRRRHTRLTHLLIVVPFDLISSKDPLSVEIDWKQIRKMMHESLMQYDDGVVLFSATVEIRHGLDIAQWALPVEAVPSEKREISVGDPQYDQFFHRTYGDN